MCKLWHFIVIDTHDIPWVRLFSAKFGKYLTPGAYINYTGLMTVVQGIKYMILCLSGIFFSYMSHLVCFCQARFQYASQAEWS